jgi:hypothetical protein
MKMENNFLVFDAFLYLDVEFVVWNQKKSIYRYRYGGAPGGEGGAGPPGPRG